LEKHKIIQVRDLIVGYGTDIILENISFDVLEGEIFIVLGNISGIMAHFVCESPIISTSSSVIKFCIRLLLKL